ncbi:floral homeotic protein APETALA 2-like [Dorcoceras hygrometricum]|uniref:Floral homeotic protein APETALA 2-like n=1 Tax=Dorcoceras hygrometricum TaxID=472368 RepID=A0A2Z7DAN2_9LAMI|nr:floral homeotic protein APETALA 2-like [Dorcoceras hygrometricum]
MMTSESSHFSWYQNKVLKGCACCRFREAQMVVPQVYMPPRRRLNSDSMDREEGRRDPPPPPPLDASGQLLAGLTRLLEQQSEAARRVRPKAVYECFRKMVVGSVLTDPD